jgi:hypothetical protein
LRFARRIVARPSRLGSGLMTAPAPTKLASADKDL